MITNTRSETYQETSEDKIVCRRLDCSENCSLHMSTVLRNDINWLGAVRTADGDCVFSERRGEYLYG